MKANPTRSDEDGEDESLPIVPSEGRDSNNSSWSGSFTTLRGATRLKILQELLNGDRDISGLASSLGLRPASIRYHVDILLRKSLVERYTPRGRGEVGRPATRLRLRSPGLMRDLTPPQNRLLSGIFLDIIESELDGEEREKVLFDVGRVAGKRLLESIGQNSDVSVWTPELFAQHYVAGALAAMSLVTAVKDLGPFLVRYRSFTCPFQELALKQPDTICDHLVRGYHEGVAAALGTDVVHERLTCMGDGDPYCEDRMGWPNVGEERG